MRLLRHPAIIALLILFAAGSSILLAGSLRYGGLDGLAVRARVALAGHALPAERSLPRPATRTPARRPLGLTLPPSATPVTPIATAPIATAPIATAAIATATPLPAVAEIAADPTPWPAPQPQSVALTGLRHAWQTWNNCGPATLAMNLSYFGSPLDQATIGDALRRSPDDKNVSPEELAEFARRQGFGAVQRMNGDATLLRDLLHYGLPVFIETWLEEHPDDGMGHYRLITGYDDARQAWIAWDAYISTNLVAGDGAELGPYAGIWLPYDATDALWKVFNRTFLIVYPQEQGPIVEALLGERLEDVTMWAGAEAQARAEIAVDPADAYAWFNLGSTLWMQGRAGEAAEAFDQARTIGLPWRMLWYQFAPFATYMAVGRPHDVLALADATLANTQSIEEIWYWNGRALEALGDIEGARVAWQQALVLYPDYTAAVDAIAALGG